MESCAGEAAANMTADSDTEKEATTAAVAEDGEPQVAEVGTESAAKKFEGLQSGGARVSNIDCERHSIAVDCVHAGAWRFFRAGP